MINPIYVANAVLNALAASLLFLVITFVRRMVDLARAGIITVRGDQ